MSEYRYKAFISYRHLEPDKSIAIRLHKMLEEFKIPKELGKGREKWRVFRDEAELPTVGDLSNGIREALSQSEFLIVVCSPNLPKSKWCLEEISYFKELHGGKAGKIITLLVDGRPEDSFPEALCTTRVTTTDEDGNETEVDIPIEPLAANVTADSLQKSYKRLRTEYLRIAAPLVGCAYDTLYKRAARRRNRRIAIISSGVAAAALAFTVYTQVMLHQLRLRNDEIEARNIEIQKQNDEIQQQNSEIQKQNSEIQQQNQLIQEQADDILERTLQQQVENSNYLVSVARQQYDSGDLISSVSAVLHALPSAGEDKPVVPGALNLLSQQVAAFEQDLFGQQRKLEHLEKVQGFRYLSGGERLLSSDRTGCYLWNCETGELIHKYSGELIDRDFLNPNSVPSETASTLLEKKNVNSLSANVDLTNAFYMYGYCKQDETQPFTEYADSFYIQTDTEILKIDADTGEAAFAIRLADLKSYFVTFFVSGDTLLINKRPFLTQEPECLEVIDPDTGGVARVLSCSEAFQQKLASYLRICALGEDYCCICSSKELFYFKIKGDRVSEDFVTVSHSGEVSFIASTSIRAFDGSLAVVEAGGSLVDDTLFISRMELSSGRVLWHKRLDAQASGRKDCFLVKKDAANNECDYLVIVDASRLRLFNWANGKHIGDVVFEREIVGYYYDQKGYVYLIFKNGEEAAFLLRNQPLTREDTVCYPIHQFRTSLKQASFGGRSYAALIASQPQSIFLFAQQKNPDSVELLDVGAQSVSSVLISPDESRMVINAYHELFSYDLQTGETRSILKLAEGSSISDYGFLGNDKLWVESYREGWLVIDSVSGDVLLRGENDGDSDPFRNRNRFYVDAQHGFVLTSKGYLYDGSWQLLDSGLQLVQEWSVPSDIGYSSAHAASADLSRLALFCNGVRSYGDSPGVPPSILIHDMLSGVDVIMETGFDEETAEVLRWSDDGTRLAAWGKSHAELYDAATGARLLSFDTGELVPVDLFFAGDRLFAVCSDGCLYEVDANGLSDRYVKLDKFSQTSTDTLKTGACRFLPDGRTLIVSWQRSAWVVDLELMDVTYQLSFYSNYYAPQRRLLMCEYNKVISYPMYTVEELVVKAEGMVS